MLLLLPTLLLPIVALLPAPATAQKSIADFTRNMEKRDDYVPPYWDGDEGRLCMELFRLGEEFGMARRRQHAAYEVGHTLGLAHNFIVAAFGRASVTDYPAPS